MSGNAAPTDIRIVWLQSGRSACIGGTVRRANAMGVAVDLAAGGPAWPPQARVVLVRGSGPQRQSAPAIFVLRRGATAVFALRHAWKAFDPRATPRYPLHVPTRIHTGDDESQRGTVLDISTGGLSVEVPEPVRGRQVDVPLWLDGYSATLRCEVVGTSGGPGHHVLHLHFLALEPAQAAFIRNMVGALAEQACATGEEAA